MDTKEKLLINYDDFITNEEKIEVIKKRIKELAIEAYQYQMNMKGFEVSKNIDAASQAASAVEALNALIEVHAEELTKLS